MQVYSRSDATFLPHDELSFAQIPLACHSNRAAFHPSASFFVEWIRAFDRTGVNFMPTRCRLSTAWMRTSRGTNMEFLPQKYRLLWRTDAEFLPQ